MDYISKTELQRIAKRSNLWGAWLVFHVWAVIFGAIAVGVIYPLTIPLMIVIIAARQHGLAILVHECAHGVLFNHRGVNDFAGRYLLAGPYGGDMDAYRKYHLKHHRYTQSERDPDLPLSAKFPTTKDSLRRKFIRDITGQTFLRLQMARRRKSGPIEGADAFKGGSRLPLVIFNIALFSTLTLLGAWWAYFVLWLLPLSTVFFAVIRLRNIAEHGMTTVDDNPLTHARTVHASLLERVFFAPYYVNYHVEHHAYMFVPCYRLPALHKAMVAAGHGPAMETKDSYRAVISSATTQTA